MPYNSTTQFFRYNQQMRLNIHPTVFALLGLLVSYLFVFILVFSTFLQIQVFEGKPFIWQSLVEQFTVFLPSVIAFAYLGKTVLSGKKVTQKNESHLLFITIALVFVVAFSLGVHTTAQIIEDYFGHEGLIDPSLKLLLFGLDELFGHVFLIFMPILFWVLMKLESNREYIKLTFRNKKLLDLMAVMAGLFWAISGLEGGSMYLLVIPLSILVLWDMAKQQGQKELMNCVLSRYYFISLVVMIVTTGVWVFYFGWFNQPEAAGLQLFNF